MKFELIYRFKHCIGEVELCVGRTDSIHDAKRWLEQGDENMAGIIDPVAVSCLADFCACKSQKPIRIIRRLNS